MISRRQKVLLALFGGCQVSTVGAFVAPGLVSRPPANSQGQLVADDRRVLSRPTALHVLAGPLEKEEERTEGDNKDSKDWIPSEDGGFIPNIRSRLRPPRRAPPLVQVTDIHEYKEQVADVQNQMVCVRFYAPWCRACKAVESKFRRLAKEFPEVKFVEAPVTKDNAYLHNGLGVPSLPFAHLYDPEAGLVEERKINKNLFEEFRTDLKMYVDGECYVDYDEDGSHNHS